MNAETLNDRLRAAKEQADTLAMHGGKKHERVFTESEVRAFVAALKDETLSKSVDHWIDHVALKVLSLQASSDTDKHPQR